MPKQSLVIGELGLSGEVRSVNLLEWRIKEAMRLGFGEILIPASGKIPKISNEIKITKVAKIQEAVDWLKNSVN